MKQSQHLDFTIATLRDAPRTLHFITLAMTKYVFTHLGCSHIMRQGVLSKFQTHTDIRNILLSTGNAEIVENSPIDFYWGCGADGSGKNMLGKILMQVREILQHTYSADVDNRNVK
ncbi:NADAR family protein [Nostoc mirabile]|uniref:NADAR family protein n=1 Tax=Nostoc mirabile TaxID=2907820 RepID=UPI0027E1D789|nr:NADAR domain-containing protein [Nostoc mirabile]